MRISDWSSDVCSSDLINAWEDLQGLKIRMAGLGGEILRRAGSVIVLTPPGEILPAMQSGAIDAAEWIGPWNDIAFGLQKVAKRSEEHTSELQSLMRISYAVFCLKKKKKKTRKQTPEIT